MCSNVLQPNPPHKTLSLSLTKLCSPNCPSASPQKIPSSSLVFQKTIFFTELCGLFGFLCLGQSFTEKTGKREPSYLSSPLEREPLSLLLCDSLFLSLSLSFILSRFVPSSPTTTPHLLLSLYLSFHL